MAKLTFAQIKQQIAALEAKAQRLAADEMKTSVAKVRALMHSLGVTIEHLGAVVSKRVGGGGKSIAGGKSAPAKRAGSGVVRYRDSKTGATWTGFGRAPAWIASAKNREDYLVGKVGSAAKKVAGTARKAVKSVTGKAGVAKQTVRVGNRKPAQKEATAPKGAAAPAKAAAKKRNPKGIEPSSKKVSQTKPAQKKSAPRTASGKKAVATVEVAKTTEAN